MTTNPIHQFTQLQAAGTDLLTRSQRFIPVRPADLSVRATLQHLIDRIVCWLRRLCFFKEYRLLKQQISAYPQDIKITIQPSIAAPPDYSQLAPLTTQVTALQHVLQTVISLDRRIIKAATIQDLKDGSSALDELIKKVTASKPVPPPKTPLPPAPPSGLIQRFFNWLSHLPQKQTPQAPLPMPASAPAPPLTDPSPPKEAAPKPVPKAKASLSDAAKRMLKRHKEQLADFERWAKNDQWQAIHDAHYDWWMFPNMSPSAGQGWNYTLTKKDIEILKKRSKFMRHYWHGYELVMRAWGWEVYEKRRVASPKAGQSWTGWEVRLGKMAESLQLFGKCATIQKGHITEEVDIHDSLRLFAKQCIQSGLSSRTRGHLEM